jgi:transcriptional regulator with XRE-family HTH domain
MKKTTRQEQAVRMAKDEVLLRVGKRARNRRKALGISVKELAQHTGLSSALLSRIENGFISPSISTLKLMSDNLGVDIGYFFEVDDQTGYTISIAKKRHVIKSERGVLIEPLAEGMENTFMDVAIVTKKGKESEDVVAVRHSGQEFLYVLEGMLELTLGKEKFVLNEADAAYFLCEIPHVGRNLSKKALRTLHVHLIPGKRRGMAGVPD